MMSDRLEFCPLLSAWGISSALQRKSDYRMIVPSDTSLKGYWRWPWRTHTSSTRTLRTYGSCPPTQCCSRSVYINSNFIIVLLFQMGFSFPEFLSSFPRSTQVELSACSVLLTGDSKLRRLWEHQKCGQCNRRLFTGRGPHEVSMCSRKHWRVVPLPRSTLHISICNSLHFHPLVGKRTYSFVLQLFEKDISTFALFFVSFCFYFFHHFT